MEHTLDILVGELASDDELRHAFFRNPRRTLLQREEWALPLSDSEVWELLTTTLLVWNRLAEQLGVRLQQAA
jgi:hypothetical protein